MSEAAGVPKAAPPVPHGDADRIYAYGAHHPEEWAGLSIGPQGRLQAWFTDFSAHVVPLRRTLQHPDLVDFKTAVRTERDLDAISVQVETIARTQRGSFYSCGKGISKVTVSLAGSALDVAAELHERFGDAVEITVAHFDYPLDPGAVRRTPPGGVTCTADLPGVTMTVELEQDRAPSGGTLRGLAWVHNTGPDTVQIHTDSELDGYFLDASGQAVAADQGNRFGRGRLLTLQPSESRSLPFRAGMDSYDPNIGTVLPPGDYDLIVAMPVGGSRPRGQLISPPTRVTVTAR